MSVKAILSVVRDRSNGLYIKSGYGGTVGATSNLQEAQIFGWSRNAKNSLKRYENDQFQVIPVTIEVAK